MCVVHPELFESCACVCVFVFCISAALTQPHGSPEDLQRSVARAIEDAAAQRRGVSGWSWAASSTVLLGGEQATQKCSGQPQQQQPSSLSCTCSSGQPPSICSGHGDLGSAQLLAPPLPQSCCDLCVHVDSCEDVARCCNFAHGDVCLWWPKRPAARTRISPAFAGCFRRPPSAASYRRERAKPHGESSTTRFGQPRAGGVGCVACCQCDSCACRALVHAKLPDLAETDFLDAWLSASR